MCKMAALAAAGHALSSTRNSNIFRYVRNRPTPHAAPIRTDGEPADRRNETKPQARAVLNSRVRHHAQPLPFADYSCCRSVLGKSVKVHQRWFFISREKRIRSEFRDLGERFYKSQNPRRGRLLLTSRIHPREPGRSE